MTYENNLVDMIFHFARTQPQKMALKFLESDYQSSQELSYQQLGDKISFLAKKFFRMTSPHEFFL
ncbi:MAG: hypothetical protein LCH30_11860 [Proteobacteria bacterium]|nr:hypothetical protein [Pseudomonadota bacterium]